MDSRRRSLVKAVSYRVAGTFITAAVAWVVTGEARFAATIGLADTLCKLGFYYVHERAWNCVSYGVMKSPEFEI